MNESCASCRFWRRLPDQDAIEGDALGYCRKNPPVIVDKALDKDFKFDLTLITSATLFPMTWEAVWCGEYTQTEETRS